MHDCDGPVLVSFREAYWDLLLLQFLVGLWEVSVMMRGTLQPVIDILS
jgi:hypothetical protein